MGERKTYNIPGHSHDLALSAFRRQPFFRDLALCGKPQEWTGRSHRAIPTVAQSGVVRQIPGQTLVGLTRVGKLC